MVALVALGIAQSYRPTVPANAGLTPVTQTDESGQNCLDRITNATGHLDLCWQVWQADDLNDDKDYYTLAVYGTVGGSGDGIRWWRLHSDLNGEPADGALQWWPGALYEGPCAVQAVSGMDPNMEQSATICGRTTGLDNMDGSYAVEWTCIGCVLPDHSNREVVLYSWVGVPQGIFPTWSIGADFGA